jgi:hypothetical protein
LSIERRGSGAASVPGPERDRTELVEEFETRGFAANTTTPNTLVTKQATSSHHDVAR